jgi:hypothetical protein
MQIGQGFEHFQRPSLSFFFNRFSLNLLITNLRTNINNFLARNENKIKAK